MFCAQQEVGWTPQACPQWYCSLLRASSSSHQQLEGNFNIFLVSPKIKTSCDYFAAYHGHFWSKKTSKIVLFYPCFFIKLVYTVCCYTVYSYCTVQFSTAYSVHIATVYNYSMIVYERHQRTSHISTLWWARNLFIGLFDR